MTISKTPRTDYRHAYKDPQMHRFTKRPDSAVTRLPAGAAVFRPDPSPKHYPAYVQHLPDDAWPDSALQEAARIQRVMSTDMPDAPSKWMTAADIRKVYDDMRAADLPAPMPTDEPVERQDWGPVVNWRSLAIGLVAIAVCVALYVAVPA